MLKQYQRAWKRMSPRSETSMRISELRRSAKRKAKFWWASNRPVRRGKVRHQLPGELILSLTSYPRRFPWLSATLRTVLEQDVLPDRFVLWIAHSDIDALPSNVRSLTRHGLEIRACDDLRSYKKIVPALLQFPDSFIATVDDDQEYSTGLLRGLVDAYSGSSNEVICHRGHSITLTPEGLPQPYENWIRSDPSTEPSPLTIATGVGGILYPPGALLPKATDADLFARLCPTADDLWLYWMARLNGSQVKGTRYPATSRHWRGSKENSLFSINKLPGGNDAQIANMIREFGTPW